jgi:DNA-directed RNA polymerase II subunit RPB1
MVALATAGGPATVASSSFSPASPSFSPALPSFSPMANQFSPPASLPPSPTPNCFSAGSPVFSPSPTAFSPASPSYSPTSPCFSPTSPSFSPASSIPSMAALQPQLQLHRPKEFQRLLRLRRVQRSQRQPASTSFDPNPELASVAPFTAQSQPVAQAVQYSDRSISSYLPQTSQDDLSRVPNPDPARENALLRHASDSCICGWSPSLSEQGTIVERQKVMEHEGECVVLRRWKEKGWKVSREI